MGIAVLGPLTVDGTVTLAPRDRVVLGALTATAGLVVTRDQLTEALWGVAPPASATKVVQGCVLRLRRAIGASAIATVADGYRLTLSGDEIDARRFERLVDRGRDLLVLHEYDRSRHALDEALALWRGPAFVDVDEWEPVRIEGIRLHEIRLEAEEMRVAAACAAGGFHDVIADARAMVDVAPLREHRWALLARAQYLAGRQGEALRVLREAREVLAADLGVDPGPELVQLEQAILHHDPSLLVEATAPLTDPGCPYPGLLPFDVDDSEHFFGRSEDLAACLRTLADHGVLAVVGPSGIGKSSLVRAGVAATLRRDGRRVEVVTPDTVALDRVLADIADPDLVLVVDQCEVGFHAGTDSSSRARFLDALEGAASRGKLVLALRADRLEELSARPEIARKIERGLHLLGPLDEAHLRNAIVGPAQRSGLLLEPGLIDLLLTEVGLERGALPLLAHALRRTWDLREGRTLTVDGYRSSGGIAAAVAQTAEQLYLGLPADRRDELRTLMLRLVNRSDDGSPVPRRLARRTIDAEDAALIDLLVNARLATSDEHVVGLAHETVARAWPRLLTWLDEDVDGQRILLHLSVAAESWEQMGRPDSELYRGGRLERAVEWAARSGHGLTAAERGFLTAAATLAEVERTDAERRMVEQARTNRRLRRLLAVGAGLLVVATLAGLLAWRQAGRADRAAVAADARSLGAEGLTVPDLDHALLLAVEGVRLEDSGATRSNLLGTLSRAPQLVGSALAGGPLVAVAASADGRLVAVGGPLSEVELLSGDDLRPVARIDHPAGALAFSRDGTQLLVAANEYTPLPEPVGPERDALLLVDTVSAEPAEVQLGGVPEGTATDIGFTGDGRGVVTVFTDFTRGRSTLAAWDQAAPEAPVAQVRLPAEAIAVAAGPDLDVAHVTMLGAGGWEVAAYDLRTGAVRRTRPVAGEAVAVATSSDGSIVAVGDGNDVLVLDATTLDERARLGRHALPISGLDFSADGTMLASASFDRTAVVWDVATGTAIEELEGHAGEMWGAVFGPDNERLFTAAIDGRLLAWDLTGEDRYVARAWETSVRDLDTFELGPEGIVAVAHGRGLVAPVAVADGQTDDPVDTGHGEILDLAWHPDGAGGMATVGEDGALRVWDEAMTLVSQRAVADGPLAVVDYTADGDLLVADRLGTLSMFDAPSLEPIGDPTALPERVLLAEVNPAGDTAVVATWDEEVLVVDLDSGDVLRRAEIGYIPSAAELSPDGRRVALGGEAGEISLLDVASGRWLRDGGPAHGNGVRSLAFAASGEVFVSGGRDGRVARFDGRIGTHLDTVQAGSSEVTIDARPRPDGTIALFADDGTFSVWDPSAEHMVDVACRIAGRDLTPTEWREAFGDREPRPTCGPSSRR